MSSPILARAPDKSHIVSSTHFYDSATAIDTVELEDEEKVIFLDSDEDAGDNEVLDLDLPV